MREGEYWVDMGRSEEMNNVQFLAIISAVWIAPHASNIPSLMVGIGIAIVGLYTVWREWK